jgi:SAM-dependent methyltransferase
VRAVLKQLLPRRVLHAISILRHPARRGRLFIAKQYLSGEGIEIGALNFPMKVPRSARVKYVDRLSLSELRREHPELNATPIVAPNIIDDGESLETIADGTQDFLIASHVLEHVQNPIQTLTHWLRVLKPGGILFLVLPDKRFTFDADRPVTTTEHLIRDYSDGPAWSRAQHFEEFATLAGKRISHDFGAPDRDRMTDKDLAAYLMKTDYSIHFHVWTPWELFDLLLVLKQQYGLGVDVEVFLQNGAEFIFVLKKAEGPSHQTITV